MELPLKRSRKRPEQEGLVIFDFDGVIVDTINIALCAIQAAGFTLNRAEFLKLFEGNFYESIYRRKEFNKRETNRRLAMFFFHYQQSAQEAKPFDGMCDAIECTKERAKIAIVSSIPSGPIDEFLKKNRLRQHVSLILGAEIAHDKVTKLRMAHRVTPNAAWKFFATDTLGDLREARRLRDLDLARYGVTWGYHDRTTLLRGKPHGLIEHPTWFIEHVHALSTGIAPLPL